MHGDDLNKFGGGLAYVHRQDDIRADELAALSATSAAARSPSEHVNVFVSCAEDANQRGYAVESYSTDGAPIQFCGHGALAAAWAVLNQTAAPQAPADFFNRYRRWCGRLAESADADIVLTYIRPDIHSCAVPEFAAAGLGVQPIAAAKSGSAADYLILELDSEQSVVALRPDFEVISAATKRALIVTAHAGRDDARDDSIVFRYFAPQYGNPEDAATGSAALQLGAYWAERQRQQRFHARQLSAQGACMQLSCTSDSVELAARVGYA